MTRAAAFLASTLALCLSVAADAAAAPRVELAAVRGSFDQPLQVTAPDGDLRRVFVVEETGRIWVLRGGRRLPRPYLDLSREVSPNAARRHAGGLLSLAFAPDYRTSGRFYVLFTDTDENVRVQAFRRASASPDRASLNTRRELFHVSRSSLQHAGGQLVFGPDGMLYIGIGDGGPAGDPENHAQNLQLLLGKILRIAPRPEDRPPYAIPADNPFQGTARVRPEIWAYGLRNPYRFAFGPSGELYVADPGQDRREEINYVGPGAPGGSNFGWSCFEGSLVFNRALRCPGAIPPALEYASGRDRCAVVGGIVGGASLGPLAGHYLYGDFCDGVIRSILVRGSAVTDRSTGLRVARLTGFGEDGRHRVYATALTGRIYRLRLERR